MIENIIVVDSGGIVLCDFCNDDFTNSDEIGGFLLQSKAVCPHCSEKIMNHIKKHNEDSFIKGFCPDFMSFADWIRSIRQ